jgi:hypothetical protein
MAVARSSSKARDGRSYSGSLGTGLEVSSTVIGDEPLRRFINEWLVPTMVDRYIGEKLGAVKDEHNGNQPL